MKTIAGALATFALFGVAALASATPPTFTVTNTGDNDGVNPAVGAGTGTLRQAIVYANATASTQANPNVISFAIEAALA